IVVAADHCRGHLLLEIVVRESADADDLVDDQRGRHVPARRDENAAAPIGARAAAAEECFQVDDRQQLAADVRDATQPELRARHPGDGIGYRQALANIAAPGHEVLVTDPEADAGPLVRRSRGAVPHRARGAREPLELEQKLERPVLQLRQTQAPGLSIRRSRTSFAFATRTASLTGLTR